MYLTLYANEKGEMFESESLMMLGRIGNSWVIPEENELIPLPKGASLVWCPIVLPVGLNFEEEIKYAWKMILLQAQ